MAKRMKKKKIEKGLLSQSQRDKLYDAFGEGEYEMWMEEYDYDDDAKEKAGDKAERLVKRLMKMQDKKLIKFAFKEWNDVAKEILGHEAEWIDNPKRKRRR